METQTSYVVSPVHIGRIEPLTIGAVKPYHCRTCGAVIAQVTLDNRYLVIGDQAHDKAWQAVHTACGRRNKWHPPER
jgi:hypothetical protein